MTSPLVNNNCNFFISHRNHGKHRNFIGLRLPLSRLGIAQARLALLSLLHRFASLLFLCHTDFTDFIAWRRCMMYDVFFVSSSPCSLLSLSLLRPCYVLGSLVQSSRFKAAGLLVQGSRFKVQGWLTLLNLNLWCCLNKLGRHTTQPTAQSSRFKVQGARLSHFI